LPNNLKSLDAINRLRNVIVPALAIDGDHLLGIHADVG
jgi:hypothetical protein